jgi:hypothetical protein
LAIGVTSGFGGGAPDDVSSLAPRAPAETSSRTDSERPFIKGDFVQVVIFAEMTAGGHSPSGLHIDLNGDGIDAGYKRATFVYK